MKVIKVTFALVAFAMAVTLLLTAKPAGPPSRAPPSKPAATARASRFLQTEERNPRAADHCNKDNDVCNNTLEDGRNATCCNNKCFDLQYDDKNCGACKKKCDFTEKCCRGECVPLAFDKRHCGACNKKCTNKGLCLYGMCSYA
ncbi:stigma-specific STIG1-like protein 2 [Salvia divinorum]|uniref:Stigma-specific STIG1-like protein 2 n=1 Tax=Salvia divinorum TaxID=28513 RepID=A0ABD1HBV1_SALDI